MYKINNDGCIVPTPTKHDLERIKKLNISKKWSDVYISKNKNDKIQAHGLDKNNKKQYVYNCSWVKKRERDKFEKSEKLNQVYSKFIKTISGYIHLYDLSKDCVISNLIKIMMDTNIRVGNISHLYNNGTRGLTTLCYKNLIVTPDNKFIIDYIGKKNVHHVKNIKNKLSCDFLRRTINGKIKHKPLDILFYYIDNSGKSVNLNSNDINNFIKDKISSEFTCKDLRTLNANIIYKKNIKTHDKYNALVKTASEMGHTPATCKKYYISPKILS